MTKNTSNIVKTGLMTTLLLCFFTHAVADKMDAYVIGGHGQANIKYPVWLKESFLDLKEDLSDASKAGKRGIVVFLSQKNLITAKNLSTTH